MIPPHDESVWPDDTRRAAVTLGLAAASNNDLEFGDVVNAIGESLGSGRSLQFVLELIRLATAGSGERFRNPDNAAAYRQLAAQCQAAEDDMRARGVWRNDGGG
ncbi:hypothetical protein [Mycobacterium sp. Marseille-P9652]|uniref:hypothetical protein n=1 Tax=Mycobacterium sp. Marseille-P9652 TaxID=2654950 RepID=UPI0012E7A709|nr:hypothetical protein [Mycobacterium sp. Marseille-P9652]